MSHDKRGDRYAGMATHRQTKLTEIGNRFHTICRDVENNGDKLLELAQEKDDKALLEIANSLLYAAVFNQGWTES